MSAAVITLEGYSVEGKIPLSSLRSLGLLEDSGKRVLNTAIFRAEFNQKPDSTIEEHWLSWIDPGVSEPDFHVPASFGKLYLE